MDMVPLKARSIQYKIYIYMIICIYPDTYIICIYHFWIQPDPAYTARPTSSIYHSVVDELLGGVACCSRHTTCMV